MPSPTPAPTALLLGGTTEARALANALARQGWSVTTSLAGRTTDRLLPAGAVRIGGFGGAAGLADHLRQTRPTVLIDATHPFAARISDHAAQASAASGVRLLRLVRPSWARTHPDAADWAWVDDHADAARRTVEILRAAPGGGAAMLTVGRQETPAYVAALGQARVLARVAEAGELTVPGGWTLLQERGPFRLQGELDLLRREEVRVLISKDSGGLATAAKLDAARALGVAVVMIRRPPPPEPGSGAVVSSVDGAAHWCERLAAHRGDRLSDGPHE